MRCGRFGPLLRGSIKAISAVIVVLAVAACSTLIRNPIPLDRNDDATIAGYSEIRYFPLTEPDWIRQAIRQAYYSESPECYETAPDGSRIYNYLAISGGGSDGAFGTGIINGWTEHGDRPRFKVVTGVSTGALIAPFAFLGSGYDAPIKEAYTTVNPDRIYLLRRLIAILWAEAVADNRPLKELVRTYITPAVVEAVAAEHAKGRRLYVASTSMDREEPVIWDLGQISSSKDPAKVDLFRSVLVASSAIPVVFPPSLITVNLDGKTYDEMHSDGGVFFQSFFIGSVVNLRKLIADAHPDFTGQSVQRLYVIRNGSTTPNRKVVNRGLGSIASRAIATLLKVSGINDLWRLYLATQHNNIEFRYVSLPADYVRSTEEEFNEAEMNRQYDLGYEMGKTGIPWMTLPPGFHLQAEDELVQVTN